MSALQKDQIKLLLRQALPPVNAEPESMHKPGLDLWPAVLRRLDQQPAGHSWFSWVRHGSSWFDGALLAGLAVITVAFPASIPLFLYYL